MKKYLLAVVCLFLWSNLAVAQSNALIYTQRNASDNSNVTRTTSPPNGVGWFFSDPNSKIPRWGTFGSTCVAPLGVLDCPGVQSDWTATTGAAFIKNVPTYFDTQRALISDATTFGQDFLALPDAPAAKVALGVPTDTGDLTNGAGFITSSLVTSVNGHTGAAVVTLSDVGGAAAVHTHSATEVTTGIFDESQVPTLPSSRINGLVVPQRVRVQTDSSGNYTWTYPTPYGSGVVPVLSGVSEAPNATDPQVIQIVGTPTNTSATFKVLSLPLTTVVGTDVLGTPVGVQAYIHLSALAP